VFKKSHRCRRVHDARGQAHVFQRGACREPDGAALRRGDFRARSLPPRFVVRLDRSRHKQPDLIIIWDFTAEPIDAKTTKFINSVEVCSVPEYLEILKERGVPFAKTTEAVQKAVSAHNSEETPLFAKDIEREATAGASIAVRRRPAERPARPPVRRAGSPSLRIKTTSAARRLSRGCRRGGRAVQAIGTRSVLPILRYKMSCRHNQLISLTKPLVWLGCSYKNSCRRNLLF
jgi:hypothetical protein